MATSKVGVNLRTQLINTTGIANCHQNRIPQSIASTVDMVWFQRRSSVEIVDLAGVGGVVDSSWDVEIISINIADVMAAAATLKSTLNGFIGRLGGSTGVYVQALFVDDHDDDYVSSNVDTDEGFYVAALDLQISYATT